MAIAFDAKTGSNTLNTSLSWSHIPVGTPSAVAVMVMVETGVTINQVKYGATDITASLIASQVAGAKTLAIYGLANPSSGTQTVLITPSANAYIAGEAITVTGSDTTTCFRVGSGISGTGSTSTTFNVSSTTTSGDFVVDCASDSSGNVGTIDGSQSNGWTQVPDEGAYGSTKAAVGSSTTMQWTVVAGGPYTWAQVAAAFQLAGAGAAASTGFQRWWYS